MMKQINFGKLSYDCNVCGKKYLRRTDLKAHIQKAQHFNPVGRQNMMPTFDYESWWMAQNSAPMPYLIPTHNRFSLLRNQGNL